MDRLEMVSHSSNQTERSTLLLVDRGERAASILWYNFKIDTSLCEVFFQTIITKHYRRMLHILVSTDEIS